MEPTKEYFCWIRVVKPEEIPDASAGGGRLSELQLEKLSEEQAVEYLRTTCPRVSWHETVFIKRPPAPPVQRSSQGRFERKTRMVLDFQPLTTVHLEQPVQAFALGIDVNPIFGDRGDALRWIETDAGQAFSSNAQAMSLMCFTVVNGRLQVSPVPAEGQGG